MKKIISSDINRLDRLPPGQRWVEKPIIYDIKSVPEIDLTSFRLKIFGMVENELIISFDDLKKLEPIELTADFHCVTGWSVKNVIWKGVQTKELAKICKPKESAKYVLVHCREGYATNFPLKYLLEEDSIFAWEMNSMPIPKSHGYPLRIVIPKLYAWKSAKYVESIELVEHDTPGFWEERGYHMRGDPWLEERYG
ncbi:oxidoreductase molybdopterin binding protein [Thermodesulfobium narugense DSM 14796]|uniref:Oxidoreductase molybdopterin binding protein n=1 Tax=Thermodesulfobium narugense DSM 14796 TaxID=747365 RepID=M1E7T8_9BACT|nr:sulfite oxidase-like oxidoreductase [Thermodesulfobium narugense]AEE14778.1 oxidoreductase molybdopterin binding protein [Thermodesulfobium narugense DSM 14796]